ncbi:glycosyltransferase family 9 protein [Winogradskyella sp. 3972H.M.0a.05]|uniref:glycosyltransferase family 9 protein n=1 Tax=Winogradskyella sp. 3972H.M.0a.05 TaxID=2950277 RepID=UPI0033952D29
MSPLPKHILVIRLSAMGDVAMTIPVLRALTQQYPEVKLTVLTRAHFAPFFGDLTNVSVFEAEVKGKHKGIIGLWKLSRAIKKLNIDAVADLHNVLRSNVLKTFLSKPCIQIDKGRAEKKALTSGQQFKQLKTTHQRYADVFAKLGFKLDLSQPSFRNKLPIPERMEYIIEATERKTKKWVGVAPFAAHESKMYPLDKMKEVIKNLSKNHKVFLFGGGEKEVSILDTIAENNKNVVNLAGKLSLDNELRVISNLDLMLSMDSGNGHLAAMFGVKVVTIWGVTHPYAGFAPFNQPTDYALTANREEFPLIPTSIYGNKYPEDYKDCAGSIPVEHIIDKVQSVL